MNYYYDEHGRPIGVNPNQPPPPQPPRTTTSPYNQQIPYNQQYQQQPQSSQYYQHPPPPPQSHSQPYSPPQSSVQHQAAQYYQSPVGYQQQQQHAQPSTIAHHQLPQPSSSPYLTTDVSHGSSDNNLYLPFTAAHPTAQLGLNLGSHMINAGHDYVSKNINNLIPQGLLKTYFNVTNSYVLRKLLIILFPFRHKNWQRTVIRDSSGQPHGFQPPRYDINSPDLYIPVMATVTYILLVGLVLGLRHAFHPSKLGMTGTAALVFVIIEMILIKGVAYLLGLGGDVYLVDLVAIIGYNFVPLIVTLFAGLIAGRMVKWGVFVYCGIAMAFFMLRSLRYSFLPDASSPTATATSMGYANQQRRTRVLFLFGIVCLQIICSCFLLV